MTTYLPEKEEEKEAMLMKKGSVFLRQNYLRFIEQFRRTGKKTQKPSN